MSRVIENLPFLVIENFPPPCSCGFHFELALQKRLNGLSVCLPHEGVEIIKGFDALPLKQFFEFVSVKSQWNLIALYYLLKRFTQFFTVRDLERSNADRIINMTLEDQEYRQLFLSELKSVHNLCLFMGNFAVLIGTYRNSKTNRSY